MTPRTDDTMLEAIALSSPSGRMSKRARKAADKRLRLALFGPDGLPSPSVVQPDECTVLLRQAAELRGLAERGMCPRSYRRKAEALEQQAEEVRASMAYHRVLGPDTQPTGEERPMLRTTLREQIDDARLVMAYNDAKLTLAWWIGPKIHVYTDDGLKVDHFILDETGSGVTPRNVREAMITYIESNGNGKWE